MIPLLQQAQAHLDAYNHRVARYRGHPPYVLVRVSLQNPTAHIAQRDARITRCGTRLRGQQIISAEEATRLCGRCEKFLEQGLV